MGEAASLVRQDAMVGIFRREFGHADAEGAALLHALEDEVDAVGALLHTAQRGQNVVLFAGSFFGPLHRDLVVAGIRLDPVPVVVGALAEDLFAHHRDAQDLPEEVDHLLGPGQTAQVPVNDDAVEAVIDQGQEIREQLDEPFHVHLLYSMESKNRGPQDHQTPVAWTGGMDDKDFRLADEIGYIQDKAADHDGRIVTIGQLILFSTDTGDAWLLDVTDHLAARLARMATPNRSTWRRPIPASPSIGRATIASRDAFVYPDKDTGRCHRPRLPDTKDRSSWLIGKFQISLARNS